METIFDHNVTDKELERFGGKDFFKFIESRGIDYKNNPKLDDDRNWDLGILFSMRGNKKKAQEYWAKIKNKKRLQLLWQDC